MSTKNSKAPQATGSTISVSEEELKTLNLQQKISLVRRTVDGFVKDTTGYQYKYVSGSQVLGKIKDTMDSLGLLLVPRLDYSTMTTEIVIIPSTKQVKVGYDAQKKQNIYEDREVVNRDYIVRMAMEYVWIDTATGEQFAVPWALFGQQDEISKAFGSGLTYSERYFLLKFFNVPTDDDDPDSRQKKPDHAAPMLTVTGTPTREAQQLATTVADTLGMEIPPEYTEAVNAREAKLKAIRTALTPAQLSKVLEAGNLEKLEDITDADLDKLHGMVVK